VDENYILPTELLALFAVWFIPPLTVSSVVQAATFKKAGIWHRSKVRGVGAILGTLLLSPLLGLLALPLPIPRWLGVSENLWILPLAWVIVLIVGLVSVKLALSRVRVSA